MRLVLAAILIIDILVFLYRFPTIAKCIDKVKAMNRSFGMHGNWVVESTR